METNAIYFIVGKTKLIKYNLFTGNKLVVLTWDQIDSYYVFDNDLIIMRHRMMWWNGKNIISQLYYPVFLKINNGIYMAVHGDKRLHGHSDSIELKKMVPQILASPDGKEILYNSNGKIFKQTIFNKSIDELFDGGQQILLDVEYWNITWISNCNCILINKNEVYNLDTNHKLRIWIPRHCFAINENVLVLIYTPYIKLHDVDTLIELGQINTKLKFIGYNKRTNILVFSKYDYGKKRRWLIGQKDIYDLQCYQIKYINEYKLIKLKIGVNYILDQDVVTKNIKLIMDIFVDTVINMLPDEILYIELYQWILRFFIGEKIENNLL